MLYFCVSSFSSSSSLNSVYSVCFCCDLFVAFVGVIVAPLRQNLACFSSSFCLVFVVWMVVSPSLFCSGFVASFVVGFELVLCPHAADFVVSFVVGFVLDWGGIVKQFAV
eukprot:684601_1